MLHFFSHKSHRFLKTFWSFLESFFEKFPESQAMQLVCSFVSCNDALHIPYLDQNAWRGCKKKEKHRKHQKSYILRTLPVTACKSRE